MVVLDLLVFHSPQENAQVKKELKTRLINISFEIQVGSYTMTSTLCCVLGINFNIIIT